MRALYLAIDISVVLEMDLYRIEIKSKEGK